MLGPMPVSIMMLLPLVVSTRDPGFRIVVSILALSHRVMQKILADLDSDEEDEKAALDEKGYALPTFVANRAFVRAAVRFRARLFAP